MTLTVDESVVAVVRTVHSSGCDNAPRGGCVKRERTNLKVSVCAAHLTSSGDHCTSHELQCGSREELDRAKALLGRPAWLGCARPTSLCAESSAGLLCFLALASSSTAWLAASATVKAAPMLCVCCEVLVGLRAAVCVSCLFGLRQLCCGSVLGLRAAEVCSHDRGKSSVERV